jgi:hypothetical protein
MLSNPKCSLLAIEWYSRSATEDKDSRRRSQASFQNWELRADEQFGGGTSFCGRLVQTSWTLVYRYSGLAESQHCAWALI